MSSSIRLRMRRRLGAVVAVTAVGLLATAVAPPGAAWADESGGALAPVPGLPAEIALAVSTVSAPVGPLDLPASSRVTYLKFDGLALKEALTTSARTGAPIGLDLFPGVHVSAVGTWDLTLSDGTTSWYAHQNRPLGLDDAVLTVRPDGDGLNLLLGSIWADGNQYEFRQLPGDIVAVAEVAPDAFETHDHHMTPDDTERSEPATEPLSTSNALEEVANYDFDYDSVATSPFEDTYGQDSYVDVAVFYSGAADSAVDIKARIKQYIANGNSANAADGINERLRLVRLSKITFTETPSDPDADLARFQKDTNIATLRNTYGADLVVLAGSGWAATGVCGDAYVGRYLSTADAAWGYSLVDVNESRCSSTSMAHELGHNMTLRHNWANDTYSGGPYSPAYNKGYNNAAGKFATIMAYTDTCGLGCKHIPYWSNPAKLYSGLARGSDETLPANPTPANDQRALKQAIGYIADYRLARDPFGSFDAVTLVPNGVRVQGWGIDPDSRNGAVTAQLWVDGAYVTSGTANQYNGYLDSASGWGAYHGFNFTAGVGGGAHSFCIKLLNLSGPGTAQQLTCRSLTVPVNPVGQITSLRRKPGGERVWGWALDPDTSAAISVQVYVDGALRTTVTANQSSPVPPSTWDDWGTSHGWVVDLSLTNGVAHNICVTGVNVSEGVNTQMDCYSITLSGNPVGEFKSVHYHPGGIVVDGWAIDPDIADYISTIQVTVDGVTKSTSGGTWYNDYDSSQPSAYSLYGGGHSFWLTIDGVSVGNHTVCVTAVNESGTTGSNTSLGCKSIYYSHDPLGSFTATRTGAALVQVTGWAIDPDTTNPISVQVTASGVTNPAVTANGSGGGNATAPASEYGSSHGFSTTVAVTGLSGQSVCVTGINTGAGSNRSLGCVTV